MINKQQLFVSRIFLLAFAAVSLTCFADTPPPTQPFTAITWPKLSKNKPSTGLILGKYKVKYEETTLAMVIQATGLGKIEEQGQTAEHSLWVCYSIDKPNQSEIVWILSDGEMGGFDHAITGIGAKLIAPNENNHDCPVLPQSMQPVTFDNGIWLDERQSDVIKTLGIPSHQEKSWSSFNYEGTKTGKCEPDGYDVMNWFLFDADNGLLKTIIAGQVTSC